MLVLPWRVVLASGSPRRRELLARLIEDFDVWTTEVEEPEDLGGAVRTATGLAIAKAQAGALRFPEALVIGSDTVVDLDGELLGKPRDAAHACEMLVRLSGRTHEVVTGVALRGPGIDDVVYDTTQVTFRTLPPSDVAAYVATGEPYDKAGGYGYQGAARGLVERIVGSETNVIGLPLETLSSALDHLVRNR